MELREQSVGLHGMPGELPALGCRDDSVGDDLVAEGCDEPGAHAQMSQIV